jgi:lysophospholipase L1-like esterase
VRYVAVGDSFTEGVGDELADGSVRGWADVFAEGLAAALGEPVQYANLAVRGRLLAPIMTEQVQAALALSPLPTMITLNGGGNDMLRTGMDASRLIALTESAVVACLEAGVRPVLVCGPDPSQRLPFGRVFRARGDVLTAAITDIGARHGVTVVDTFHDGELRRAPYWSSDRLHLNAAGHRRVAGLVLRGLGYQEPVTTVDAVATSTGGALAELRYYAEHVRPWLLRRLRGRSSGDGRTGKHLDWVPVPVPSSGSGLRST